MEDIRNAKRNVKIVSPYLSPYLIKELILLHSRGLRIKLITNDKIEDFDGSEKNIHQLILQDKHVNKEEKQKRDKLIKLSENLLIVILLTIALVFLFFVSFSKIGICLFYHYYWNNVFDKKFYY
ncbi:phospholipase D-like domain-containing protein [Chryseobacterium sp. C-71]|uniref:phospholipase D-like domain-containing protein n=1 Tax=Chryseobacterium sp. C-71 TaxID=2893882 RepID=UPI001E636C0D|nr:phospholipase D-like domain-containing protein [Chryseobacterium sp. C-71]UFH31400.1 phospholipase D-like domain-containing protein [Chryseobacterium sp. C-71]